MLFSSKIDTSIIIGAASVFLMLCTPVSAQPAPAAESKIPQANAIEQSCRLTMGLEPASSQYAACVDSLKLSAAANADLEGLKQQRLACIQRGLSIGTPDFANCVANRPIAGSGDRLEATKESKACEDLGLAPGDPGFGNCVISLRTATESDPASYALMH